MSKRLCPKCGLMQSLVIDALGDQSILCPACRIDPAAPNSTELNLDLDRQNIVLKDSATNLERYWYYYDSERQIGPVAEDEFVKIFGSGSMPAHTLVWTEGLPGWTEAKTIDNLVPPAFAPPPVPSLKPASQTKPPPISSSQPASNSNIVLEMATDLIERINPYPAMVLVTISTVLNLIPYMIEIQGGIDASFKLYILFLPVGITATVLWAILHYKCWKIVPSEFRATTPGKATGLLFVPVFHLFWAFVSWPKLAEGLVRWGQPVNQQVTNKLIDRARWCSIFFVASFFVGVFPPADIGGAIMIIGTIVWFKFYGYFAFLANQMVTTINPKKHTPSSASWASGSVCVIGTVTIVPALLIAWGWVENFYYIHKALDRSGNSFIYCMLFVTFFCLMWPPLVGGSWLIGKACGSSLPPLGRKAWFIGPVLGIPFAMALSYYLFAPAMAPYRLALDDQGESPTSSPSAPSTIEPNNETVERARYSKIENHNNPAQLMIGKWVASDNSIGVEALEFFEDGTMIVSLSRGNVSGTYLFLRDGKIKINFIVNGSLEIMTSAINIQFGSLRFLNDDGSPGTTVFTKQ